MQRADRRVIRRRRATSWRATAWRAGSWRTAAWRAGLVLLLAAGPTAAGPAAVADEGPWGWPLAGEPPVGRPFDPPAVRYASGHRGVDLVGSTGAPVLAAAAGRVSYAGLLAGRGVVVVSHGALRTTYEPVTAAVPVGTRVALGEVLGRLEAAHLGCPAAACLHWGLKRGEQYLDPVRLVRRGPVRLLPLDGSGDGGAGAAMSTVMSAAGADAATGGTGPGGSAGGGFGSGSDGGGPGGDGSGPASGAGGQQRDEPRTPPVDEPRWSLRAAEAPLGVAALAALVVGIGLLVRPRPGPAGPASGGTGAAGPADLDEQQPAGGTGELVDLEQARLRRRSG